MLRNYLIIALRNLRRQPGYAAINVFGLAVGLASFIVIVLFVLHELSYDRFHQHADRIFRVVTIQPGNVFLGTDRFVVTPAPLASTLVQEFPDVETATTTGLPEVALLSLENRHFSETGLAASEHFFEVFSFPLLKGDPETVLAGPGSLVLAESLARRIFGDTDPMGQTLLYRNREPLTVTGIMADVPETSHLSFDFLTSLQSDPGYAGSVAGNSWSNRSWMTYVVLAAGTGEAELQRGLPAFVDRHEYAGREDVLPEQRHRYMLQPLGAIHLRSSFNFDVAGHGDIRYVYLFLAIAVVILLLACVNYANLAVARSLRRAREVAMRKAVGARWGQLVGQFLGEAVLMAAMALLVALVLVHLMLPVFGALFDRPLRMDLAAMGRLLPGLAALVLVVGLLAGSYPALVMAALRPMQVMKGVANGPLSRLGVQRVLIVGQYVVSIALVAGSVVIFGQLRYVQHKDVGYDRDHLVTAQVTDEALHEHYPVIREEWLRDPRVVAVTATTHLPTNITSATTIGPWEGSGEDDVLWVYQVTADYDFLEVFDIELLAGRMFSRELAGDRHAYLVNETAARAMGWTPAEAVGRQLTRSNVDRTIIGVVKDFHMHSMHMPIEPLFIGLGTQWMDYLVARVRPEDVPTTLALMEGAVSRFTPYPFEYRFLNEHFDQLYRTERRLGEMFGFFTILALLIASLGIFGLAAYAAEQRRKEIAVRKVLGGSAVDLVGLLSKDFLKLVAVAFLLAAPLAYFGVSRWLETFAYRIEPGLSVFVLSGLFAAAIAFMAVSYHALRAATADPVTALRSE